MKMRQLTYGSKSTRSSLWETGTEEDFIRKFEGQEGYTGLYSYYNLPETTVERKEDILKEFNLVFDRLVFDLDNQNDAFAAIKQGIKLYEWFKEEFPSLYSEVWFSGNKGAHVYVYFKPIEVKNPKEIYKHVVETFKTKLGFDLLDTSISDIYSRAFRAKNSRHPKTGYYKVNITNAVDMGKINSMDDIYKVAQNPTVSFPKFNNDFLFIDFIKELDATVTVNTNEYDSTNQYITSNATEPIQKALMAIWKEGQRDKVAFPLLHCLYRAGKTEQEARDFFSFLPKSEYDEIIRSKIHSTYNNPLTRKVGLPTLAKNWSEVGGDLTAIDDYFTIIREDSIFYPYKPPIVDDSNVELPDGWNKTHQKGTKFTFEKEDLLVKFKGDFISVCCGNDKIFNGKFDKRKLSKMAIANRLTEYEIQELKDSTSKLIANRENEHTILMRELNSRLGAGETKKTARTVAKYFSNRKGYITPKGVVMMGTDNIGRFVSQNDLKQLLIDDFNPSQLVTHDYFDYIQDLPVIHPNYNMLRCANGFFDFSTGKFSTRATEPVVIMKESPYNYRPELISAPVPTDLQLLFDNLHNASVKSLLEVIGYCLSDGNPLKVVIIFIGDGDSGKTIIMNLTGALLGNNTSSVDIFNIEETNISLITKDLNLISEYRKTSNEGLATLKNYSGNESMEFREIYGKFSLFPPEAISKTILATNNLNGLTKHTDRSTFNRFKCIIEFKKSYNGDPDTGIEDRILNNSDTMDWLLTNAINAYVTSKGVLDAIRTPAEVKQLINYYDNPISNEIRETFDYIPLTEQRIHAESVGHKYMDDREYLIEYGVTMDEIKEFYDKHGEITPKQPIRELKHIFDDKDIERVVRTVNGEKIIYIVGLVRK